MSCDEFEAIGWDAQGNASSTDAQRAAAAEHAVSCTRCGALRNSWEATRLELRSLAQLTTSVEAPARVEMRLRQQFRTEYHTPKVRRTAVVTAWTLAAAAVLVGAPSWVNWRASRNRNVAVRPDTPVLNGSPRGQNAAAESQSVMADSELSDLTLLPGGSPADTDDASRTGRRFWSASFRRGDGAAWLRWSARRQNRHWRAVQRGSRIGNRPDAGRWQSHLAKNTE